MVRIETPVPFQSAGPLDGTVDVDVPKLSADDKLTLPIKQYNRKLRDDGRQNR